MTGNWLVADEVVFEKQLPDGKKLVASNKQVPYIPPTKEEIEETRKMLREALPETSLEEFPDPLFESTPTFECTLALVSSDGKQERKLWLLRYEDVSFGRTYTRASVEFFDATFASDTLLIVFRARDQLLAEVVKYKPGEGLKSYADPRKLSEETATSRFKSAKIEGSFEDESIAVILKLTDGNRSKSSKWVLKKNEWTEVPASLLDKPAPPGLKKTE